MTLTIADLLAIWGPLLLFGVGALAWIRADLRGLETRLRAEIRGFEDRLSARIGSFEERLSARIRGVGENFGAEVVKLDQRQRMSGELLARIDERQRFGGAAEPAPPAPNGGPGTDPQPEAAPLGGRPGA